MEFELYPNQYTREDCNRDEKMVKDFLRQHFPALSVSEYNVFDALNNLYAAALASVR